MMHEAFILRLMRALGCPENVVSFELKASVDNIVTVKCEYYPPELPLDENEELIRLTKEFKLVEKDS